MSKGPNLFGLLTLSVPMLVMGFLAYPVLLILGLVVPAARRVANQVKVIIRANFNLIHRKAFFPLWRCKLAGILFRLSPRISGWLYRSFNLTAFLLIWLVLLLPVLMWVV